MQTLIKKYYGPARRELAWQLKHRWTAPPGVRAHLCFQRALDHLRPGDIAIDCGCNQGWVTAAMAATGATVYAFDPEPSVVAAMEELCHQHSNIVFERKAVGVEDGQTTMYRHESFSSDPNLYSVSSTLFADKRHASMESAFDVDVIGLPDFIQRLAKRVAILKLDVEGAEVAILHALLDREMMDKIGQTFTEMHEDRILSLQQESARLRRRIAGGVLSRRIFLDWG